MNNPVTIFWIISAWYILFLVQNSFTGKKYNSTIAIAGSAASLVRIGVKNIPGAIILCLPLIILFNDWRHLFTWPVFDSMSKKAVLLSILVAITIIALQNGKRKIGKTDPVPTSVIAFFVITRVIFLVCYECFFRGLLLSVFINAFGIPIAIAINIFLYSIIHSSAERLEMILCIPFGLMLCMVTLWYHSVLPAIILHLALSLVNELSPVFFSNNNSKIART